MNKRFAKRLLSVFLLCVILLPGMPAFASQTEQFVCEKTAQIQPDGTAQITLRAMQTGRVEATDVVLVLDVSASMEHNSVVSPDKLDGTKSYYMIYERPVVIDGTTYTKRDYVLVQNTAQADETPTWYATMPDADVPTRIDPQTTPLYTGAMDNLREASASFVQSIAENAALYDVEHRIAVVEFSSPTRKNDGALCTHDNAAHTPFYANILSGDGTAQNALLPVRGYAQQLQTILSSLQAGGPTYSDDAMTQAQRILAASAAEKRVVILFTDGGPGSYGWDADTDNSALPTANGAIESARVMKSQGVQIYTIGVFNEANLSGEIGQKNETYLNLISSNYPDARSMDGAGEQAADSFCSIGETDTNLQDVFSAISAVLGTPVHGAGVRDTVSESFFMTDAQKEALRQQYPAVRITENADGTTEIALDDVDFPTVAVRADGAPVDPQDDGIFTMTFSVTPKAECLGGRRIATNTGVCGVFAGSVPFAQFNTPDVFVPVREALLDSLLSVRDGVRLYAGETLRPQDLYADLSDSRTASYADSVTYTVTDAAGAAFTGGVQTSTQTFTVTAHIRIDGTEYIRTADVPVEVMENPVTTLEIVSAPNKKTYIEGDAIDLAGLQIQSRRKSGAAEALTAADVQVEPAVLNKTGEQTVTLRFGELTAQFTVTVQPVRAVSARVIETPSTDTYVYRYTPDFSGLAVEITYNNGKTQIVRDLSDMTIRAQSDARVRRGMRTFTVTTQGVSASFAMRVKLVWWQWLILILLFGWIWY